MRKVLKFLGKLIKWVLISLLLLLILVAIVVKVPAVHDFILHKGTAYFNEQTGGNLSVESIDLRIPSYVSLKGISLQDPQDQKVASVGNVEVSIGWRYLFKKTIRIDKFVLEDVDAQVLNTTGKEWNYDFIVNSFTDSTATPQPKDTTASDWDFSLGQILLHNIHATYYDATSNDSIVANLSNIEVDMEKLSILNNIYHVDEFKFEDSHVFAQLGERIDTDDETEKSENDSQLDMDIGINDILLARNVFQVQMGAAPDKYTLQLGNMHLKVNQIDLAQQVFDVEKLTFENSYAELQMAPSEPDTTNESLDIFAPLQLSMANLLLNEISFNMKTIGSLDEDLNLENIHVELADLRVDSATYAGRIKSLKGVYNQLDNLQNFKTDFLVTPQNISLSSLFAQYGQSTFNANLNLDFNDLNRLVDSLEFNNIELKISDTRFEPTDLLDIGHGLNLPDSLLLVPKNAIHIDVLAGGNIEKLNVNRFDVSTGKTSLHIRGSAHGKNWKSKSYFLPEMRLHLERDDIAEILRAFELDQNMVPPVSNLVINGNFETEKSDINAIFSSSYGGFSLTANGGGWNAKTIPVDAHLKSSRLEVGKFLGLDVPFITDLNLVASATNVLDTNTNASAQIRVDTITYDTYKISNIDLDATLEDQMFSYQMMVADTFVVLNLGGSGRIQPHMEVNLAGDIDGVDFHALGLSRDDMRGKLAIKAEYFQKGDTLAANALINHAIFVRKTDRFELQPIEAKMYMSPDSSMAEVKSEFFDLYTVTNRDLAGLTNAIVNVLSHGNRPVTDSTAYWHANFESYESSVLKELFLPELNNFAPATATVDFEASKSSINADVNFPEISYSSITIDSLRIKASGNRENIAAGLRIKEVAVDTLALEGIHLKLGTTDTGAKVELLFNDIETEKDTTEANYYIALDLIAESDTLLNGFSINLVDSVILNSQQWQVDPENDVRYSPEGIELSQLRIFKEDSELGVHKHSHENKMHIKAVDFDLANLSGIIRCQSQLIAGNLYADFDVASNKTFEGSGRIEDFEVAQANFGLFTWFAEGSGEKLKVSVSSTGEALDFTAYGNLIPQDESDAEIDMKLILDKFDFNALPKIIPSIVSHGQGVLTANIDVTGTTSKPDLKGDLNFKNNEIGLTANGAVYKITDQKINISPNKIGFNKFTLIDSENHPLIINGGINHEYFDNISADLQIKASDFEIANLTADANQGYYGKLLANLDIGISGKITSPKIDAGIEISEKTDLTVVVPESEYHDDYDDEMIVWVDFDHPDKDEIITRTAGARATAQSAYGTMIDLAGSININYRATFRLLIDSLAGDYLEIQGGGKLGITYDRTGNLNLNGTYQVHDGFYQMTFYNIVKRKFNFQEGSRLTWNGDPMDADIDITALYKTNVNVATLMSSQSGVKSNQAFSQKLPFEVVMHISGELMQPELKFSIRLAKESKGALGGAVDARLNEIAGDESELNKQVFALLVLGTFISTESSGDNNFIANQARNSASQILSQQLNALSDKLITGVDLNFDLESYELGGQGTTDLNIDLAKSFMDDRIIVRVGSTIALEDNQNTQNSQEMMTSFSLEYKLTPEGVYRLKIFRTNDLEDIVVGRITRTGGGIMYQKDFNQLKNIFQIKSDLVNPDSLDMDFDQPNDSDEDQENDDSE